MLGPICDMIVVIADAKARGRTIEHEEAHVCVLLQRVRQSLPSGFAGYAVEVLFSAFQLIPPARVAILADPQSTFNYTTSVLNVASSFSRRSSSFEPFAGRGVDAQDDARRADRDGGDGPGVSRPGITCGGALREPGPRGRRRPGSSRRWR